jgi:hypothetical protein
VSSLGHRLEAPSSDLNNRQFDLERTAEELSRKSAAYIRAKYIRDNVREETSFKWKAILYANASAMSNGAFRKFVTDLTYADSDGGNAFQSNETSAKLTGNSIREIDRANSELAKLGFREIVQRRQRKSWIVKCQIPQKVMDAISFELLELPRVADQKPLDMPPVADQSRLDMPPVEVQEFRTATGGSLPIVSMLIEGKTSISREEGCEVQVSHTGEQPSFFTPIAEPLATLERKEKWAGIVYRFGRMPGIENARWRKVDRAKSDTFLSERIRYALRKHPAERVEEALDNALSQLTAKNEAEPKEGASARADSCQRYFRKVFDGELLALEKQDREREIADALADAKLQIEIKAVAAQAEHRVNGTATRTQLWNQAAAKQIEGIAATRLAAPAKMNGHPTPVGDSRTLINAGGKRRYKTDFALVKAYGQTIVFGEHANKLLEELEAAGATFEDIDDAFGNETGTAPYGDRQALSRPEILHSVGERVKRSIKRRRNAELKEKFGPPEALCGGTADTQFTSEWLALSAEWIAALFAKCPDIRLDDNGRYGGCNYGIGATDDNPRRHELGRIFDAVKQDLTGNHDDYGNGLQQRAESDIERRMLIEQASEAARREEFQREAARRDRERHGIWLNESGAVEMSGGFWNEINRCIAKRPVRERLCSVVKSIPDSIERHGAQAIASRIRDLFYMADLMSEEAMRAALTRDEIGRAA